MNQNEPDTDKTQVEQNSALHDLETNDEVKGGSGNNTWTGTITLDANTTLEAAGHQIEGDRIRIGGLG